ncbi:hypothetical protein BABINDRAFT_159535 [Babjeviella inositovora NRRL Y-12698]|uniref:Uncharacterized protein n=1 Tax=Babjeviella inositovora NRRL Y-12698 TaxID=984486 RepID=A0A1E3QZV2_9ASCO|nr:uncharacterized protein BABINDRAFT_159535 [Babjeviella inositovora NRRL Y-12698]ODQ83074.1 hypothetical protein BABINDRAFT_159535 [Babjeviella inositovora NRRL Y-12698]
MSFWYIYPRYPRRGKFEEITRRLHRVPELVRLICHHLLFNASISLKRADLAAFPTYTKFCSPEDHLSEF